MSITVTGSIAAGSESESFTVATWSPTGALAAFVSLFGRIASNFVTISDTLAADNTVAVSVFGVQVDTIPVDLPASIGELVTAAEAQTGVKPVITFKVAEG